MSVTKDIAAAFPLKLTERAFQSGGQPQGNPSFPTYDLRKFLGGRDPFSPIGAVTPDAPSAEATFQKAVTHFIIRVLM